jgi:beta-1,4-N-acetylglucosaminyltransferase
MIFLTVGTEFPFDRLVRAVDQMRGDFVLTEEVYAQIGDGNYRPRHMSWVRTMDRLHYDQKMRECSAIIAHAGVGTILSSMELHKPLLVMPRLQRYKEHIDDHQLGTVRSFESLGYILVAYNTEELFTRVKELYAFQPRAERWDSHVLVDCIKKFLHKCANQKK